MSMYFLAMHSTVYHWYTVVFKEYKEKTDAMPFHIATE